ncbi:MAG: hypothetical protein QM504_15365 [Pseudomonadota bacterium]
MKFLKIIKSFKIKDKHYLPGDMLQFSNKTARELLQAGIALPVERKINLTIKDIK